MPVSKIQLVMSMSEAPQMISYHEQSAPDSRECRVVVPEVIFLSIVVNSLLLLLKRVEKISVDCFRLPIK